MGNISSSSGDEQAVAISILIIAAIVVFFLVIAWCGFFCGLWRNRKMAMDISRNREQQIRQRKLLQQRQQKYHTSQQQAQQRGQQTAQPQLQQNANRSRPPSQLSPSAPPYTNFAQPGPSSQQTPFYGDRISVHSGYITPMAAPLPVVLPPRDYDDQMPLHTATDPNASQSSGLGYHNRATFDHLDSYASPDHSFVNIGYQSATSYPDGNPARLNHSSMSAGYTPVPPRSTSTPIIPKSQAKQHRKISQPASYENYMEMQQYQQLQEWPQNY